MGKIKDKTLYFDSDVRSGISIYLHENFQEKTYKKTVQDKSIGNCYRTFVSINVDSNTL